MRRFIRPRSRCALALSLACASASAQHETPQGVHRPRASERIIRSFDFEERLTNPLDVPAGWLRVQHDPEAGAARPGYPIWNAATLDYKSPASSGEGSVRLPVRGGSASLRLERGSLPIFAGAEYAVRALARTSDLDHARARIVVRLIDAQGGVIPGSERSSPLARTPGTWMPLEVLVPGEHLDAAFLQVDLEALQPQRFEAPTLGEHQIWDQDFAGAAWFDDVTVWQLPSVRLTSQSPLHVFQLPDRPAFDIAIRDLAGEDIQATTRIIDTRGTVVDEQTTPIHVGRAAWRWEPRLTELGPYRLELVVASAGGHVAAESLALAWVPAPPSVERRYVSGARFEGVGSAGGPPRLAGRQLFAVELTEDADADPASLPYLLDASGAGSLTIPLWTTSLTPDTLPDRVDAALRAIDALRDGFRTTTISLPHVPRDLASVARLDDDNVVAALLQPAALRDPYLAPALDRMGAAAIRWQLGGAGNTSTFAALASGASLPDACGIFDALVPGTEIALGWRADLTPQSFVPLGSRWATILLPAWMPSAPVQDLVDDWVSTAGSQGKSLELTFCLEPIDAETYGERAAAADLTRRAVAAWDAIRDIPPESGVQARLAVNDLWRARPSGGSEPSPLLPAWRNLTDRLVGRRIAARWDALPGARCYILGPDADSPADAPGALVLWNEFADPRAAELVASLASGPVEIVDLFGNRRVLEPELSEDGSRLEHRIPIPDEPIFVEGVDTGLALFLSDIRLDPPTLDAISGEQQRDLVIRNPWPGPIAGRLVIAEPGGFREDRQARDRSWSISPRAVAFDLRASEELRVPLSISFSRSEQAGTKDFVFDIQVSAEQMSGWVRARAKVELGWDELRVDLSCRATPEGDLLVEASVTNTGERTLSLEATAFAPNHPRARAGIGSLAPGESVIRRFPFPGAARTLAGQRIILAIGDAEGHGRLTHSVEAPR